MFGELVTNIGKGILGEIAGTVFGGGGGSGGAGGGDSASLVAATAQLGFAKQVEVAMQMAENAAAKGAQERRKHDPKEGKQAQNDEFVQQIARSYQKGFQDSRVRVALLDQLNRQASTNNAAISTAYDFKDAEPTLTPTEIV